MAQYYQDEEWSASETEESDVGIIKTRSKNGIAKPTMKKLEVVTNKIGQKLPDKKDDAPAPKKGGLSEYELQIQRNIEERKKIFQMLNLGDAKKELAEAFGEPAVKRKAKTEDVDSSLEPRKLGRPRNGSVEEGDQLCSPVVKKYKYTKLPEQPLQMALRERKTNLRYNEHSPKKVKEPRVEVQKKTSTRSRQKMIELLREKPSPLRISLRSKKRYKRTEDTPDESMDEQDSSSEKSCPSSSGSLTLSNTYFDQGSPEESIAFVEDVNEYLRESQEPKKETTPSPNLLDFIESMKTFELDPDGSVALIPKTTCLTWHPNANHALLAAANGLGSIGFWDCDYDQGDFQRILCYDVHSKPVSALSFDEFNPYRMFSTGKEGSVHYLDFRTGCFDQIYAAAGSKNASLTHHAQVGASLLLVSQEDGNVMVLDTRVDKPAQLKMVCFDRSILMLSPHPINEDHFMASTEKNVGIFDLRKAKRLRNTSRFQEAEPVLELPDAPVKLRGALFSPLTGNLALTMGQSLFEIFDLQNSSAVNTMSLPVVNKNYAINRAYWYPNREDVFVVNGSDDPDYPRDIGLRHAENGEILHTFESNSRYKSSELSAFHSSLPIFAVTGNGSKVNLYRSSS